MRRVDVMCSDRIKGSDERWSVRRAATFHGFTWIDITPTEAEAAGALEWDHRDPFDRMLAAQSLARGLTLVTDDSALKAAPGIRTL